MPWSELSPMDQKTRFVADYLRQIYSMTELCARFGISRKTGYKWIQRYADDGPEGLLDRSRRPDSCPHETPDEVVQAIVEVRRRHPTWGAKKLLTRLETTFPHDVLPGRSTVCDILKRQGLVAKKRRRRKLGHPGKPDTPMNAPNDVWTTDFKGHFRTRDGIYCYPLTVADGCSRFVLGCQALSTTAHYSAKPVFRRLFQEFGLPSIMRSDNGVPFATTVLARLSQLSVWWIRLGVYPELIEPGHPEQNGRHERMHRTLKAEATRPPAANRVTQQRRFNRFLKEFNHERPHEALGQKTPASVYKASRRPYPEKLPDLDYPAHFEVRLVSENGGVRWHSKWVNVSHVLAGEYIGLEEVDDGLWNVYFGPIELGRLDERDLRIEDALGRKSREKCYP